MDNTDIAGQGILFSWATRTLGPIDFHFPQGACVWLKGPNGVGKTTLLRMLAGLIEPDEGVFHQHSTLYLPVHSPGYPQLNGYDNLSWLLDVLSIERPSLELQQWIEQDLWLRSPCWQRPLAYWSTGERKRLQWACWRLSTHPIVCLDEPLACIDAAQSQHLEAHVKACRLKQTLFIASHQPISWATHIWELQ